MHFFFSVTVLHEAISSGDPELIQEILERRDFQRYSCRVGGIPELLKRIRDVSSFEPRNNC